MSFPKSSNIVTEAGVGALHNNVMVKCHWIQIQPESLQSVHCSILANTTPVRHQLLLLGSGEAAATEEAEATRDL